MVGSYLDSPLYRQMLAQTMQQGPASQYPGQAIANGLAQALQAYTLKNLGAKEEAKQQAGNADLAKALLPEQFSGSGYKSAGPDIQLGDGLSLPNNMPQVSGTDMNADKRQQLASLLNSGVVSGDTVAPLALKQLGISAPKDPIKLGKDDGLYDATTFQPIISPKEAPQPGFTLSQGQQRFDATGKPVASVAPEVDYNKPFLPDGSPNPAYQKYEMGKTVAGRPSTNIALNTEKTFAGGVASNLAGQFTANREKAQSAAAGIQALQEAKQLLNSGIFTGQLGELQLLGAKMGMGDTSKIANTEAFQAAMGRQTLALVKNLGAGSGISNADREYAERVAGGKITLNQDSLAKIIDINERAQRGVIKSYNAEAQQVAKSPSMAGVPVDMMVPEPPQTMAPQQPQPAQGGMPTVNTPEEAARLPRGTRFRTPDGQIRMVP